jgi:hypothetical protein
MVSSVSALSSRSYPNNISQMSRFGQKAPSPSNTPNTTPEPETDGQILARVIKVVSFIGFGILGLASLIPEARNELTVPAAALLALSRVADGFTADNKPNQAALPNNQKSKIR